MENPVEVGVVLVDTIVFYDAVVECSGTLQWNTAGRLIVVTMRDSIKTSD